MKFSKNIGMLLLGVYLILVGVTILFHMPFGDVLPILAIITGVFILIGK